MSVAARSAPRIAILGCRGIPARYGGFETFAEELGTRLVARGFRVTVFCHEDGSADRSALPREVAGVELERVRVPHLGPVTALVYDLLALRRARMHDVVYMLGYGAGPLLGLARRAGNRVWVNMDGLEWHRSKWGTLARAWFRRAERAALRKADRCIFDNAALARTVLGTADGALDPGRTSVIEYGADLELEHDPGVLVSLGLRARGYALVVARIEPENHVLEILRAHGRAEPELALLVVGDVERAGRYGELCRAAARPNVRFLGAVFDRRTLYSLRRECAAAIHGHSVGGTNPSLLEAMAAGAALIAHDNPYNREVLEERALWFRNEAELVEALGRVVAWTPEERTRQAAANRARIAERYTWERITDEYEALLGGGAATSVVLPAVDAVPAPLASVATVRREEYAP